VPFVEVDSTHVRMELQGQDERALSGRFTEAKRLAEQYGASVLFIDEMDAIFNEKNTHDTLSKQFNEEVNRMVDDPKCRVLLIG
jgi:SpoVK/Ycf46/Vps4 family AAA+-type ATPase